MPIGNDLTASGFTDKVGAIVPSAHSLSKAWTWAATIDVHKLEGGRHSMGHRTLIVGEWFGRQMRQDPHHKSVPILGCLPQSFSCLLIEERDATLRPLASVV
jgi:hypothetical protein